MSDLLQNFRINLRTRIKFLNSFVRSRLTYACQNWNPTLVQLERLNVTYRKFLRRMVRGGFRFINEKENDYRLAISNDQLHEICNTTDVSEFICKQQTNYVAHVIRMNMNRGVKQLLFNDDTCKKKGRPQKSLLEQVVENKNSTIDDFCNFAMLKKTVGKTI